MPQARLKKSLARLMSFGGVGLIAFFVDLGVYNLLRSTVFDDGPIWSKVFSVTIATCVAWIGNRYLTFRKERSGNAVREGILFAVANLLGLLIASACLFVSHYVLGYTSQLADNIAGNGVGLVLGTAFRFAAYRLVVFGPLGARLMNSSRRAFDDLPQPTTHATSPLPEGSR